MSSGRDFADPLARPPTNSTDARLQTLSSFEWQWKNLAAGDFMPGDPWFDMHAAHVLADELCGISPTWFQGKTVLDAGCGQGRWTRALLELGANVTAIDFSDAGLARTRDLCAAWPDLKIERVDLLSIPDALSAQRFDLVFSFGVLHHTGNTSQALDNVAGLVADGGALVLYLYGTGAWTSEDTRAIEDLRAELAALPFDKKIETLLERFPHEDPHQLFDLLSPAINDRVHFEVVAARLRTLGFDRVERTIESGEVFLRALRPGFRAQALREPVLARSEFARESDRRWRVRKGIAHESLLRAELVNVPRRVLPPAIQMGLARMGSPLRIFDASLPPDSLASEILDRRSTVSRGDPRLEGPPCDAAVWLGASLGASRYPEESLRALMSRTARGGVLVAEIVQKPFTGARRSWFDRARDARVSVPEKLGRLLKRNPAWCTGHGLFALGGVALLNPLSAADAIDVMGAWAASHEFLPARDGTVLLVAQSRR
jgi:SAM-dependent methyltransferase